MNKGVRMMLLSSRNKDNDGRNRDDRDYRYDDRDGMRNSKGRIEWETDRTRRYEHEMRYDNGYRMPENRRGGMRGNDYGRIENRYDNGRMDLDYRGGEYNDRSYPMSRSEYFPDVYSAFTDRNGRRHYDNGRYAPQNRYDDNYNEPYRNTTMGFTMPQYHHKGYEFEADGMAGDMRGYMRGNIIPMDSSMWKNGKNDHKVEELDEETAKKWVSNMKNVDGTKGQHFSMEQTEQLMNQYNIDCSIEDFYAALNMVYSDYREVAKKFNADKPEFYVCMARAFLDDPDIPGDGAEKLSKYYEYIVLDK